MKRYLMVLGVVLCLSLHAFALPKFATRQGAKCQSCHINPTGKGMRSAFGATYGREEVPMPTFKDKFDLEEFSPALNDFFTIGMDYRTLFFYQPDASKSSFFQMQGDLYFDLRINKKFRIYFDKGLYNGFEVFGLAKVLPLEGYIKVGKFVPAYGIKLDEHNAFIRGGQFGGGQFVSVFPSGYPYGLRFGERAEDTGIEIGFTPSIFSFNIGVFNGTPGGGINGTNGEKTKAAALRGDVNLQTDFANAIFGGSVYHHPNATIPGKTQFYGGFAILSIGNNLTLTGEADYVTTYHSALKKEVTGMMFYSEISYVILQGLDAKISFENYDPNLKLANGAFSTIGVGAEFFPMTGLEVRPMYKLNREKPKEISNDEFQLLFHFYL